MSNENKSKKSTSKRKSKSKIHRKRKKELFLTIDDWLQEQCVICCSPMREWEDDPSGLDEHCAIDIIQLSCGHHFHKACLMGAIQARLHQSPQCPLCRRTLINFKEKCKTKRTSCRYRKSLSNPSTSCKRPEACHNMGFCRVHLPVLPGLTGLNDFPFYIELGNRKSLYKARDKLRALGLDSEELNSKLREVRNFLISHPHFEDIIQLFRS